MKVICIDDINHEGNKTQLKIGETYTASQCPVYPNNYDLLEIPKTKCGRPVSYRKHMFIPLSSIDETEMIREYKTEPV